MAEANPDPIEEAEILRRLRAGDGAAFEILMNRHQREIYRLAYRLTRSHEESDDLVQETFLRAHQGIGRFRGESSLRTWLQRITVNLALNLRESARVSRRERVDVEDVAPPASPRGLEGLIEDERRRLLSTAVGNLPPKQRATLVLRVAEGLKFKEVAAVLGCTVGTAKANFFHAVAALRRAVGDESP